MAGACPPPRVLEALAASGEDEPVLRAHVQDCAACRELIDEIRENQQFLRGAAKALALALDAPGGSQARAGAVPGFELLEEIGRGGQGVVYRAVQSATRRPAAVKMLLTGNFATQRQLNRFEREIEIAARLRHPNIVSIFESGTAADGRRYVAMEYVVGEPLDRYVRTRLGESAGPARITRILRICCAVAAAVGHAHASGVIHRDLKPSNILVDAAGNPRVLDFGLARELDPVIDATVTREFAGTPAFAAPEQFASDAASIDVRTDVYSLGLLIYTALCGAHPYPCDGALTAIIEHVRTTEPKPLSAHVPRMPADVETIVLKALSKDPRRRYPNAQALAADIEDYLSGQPISARRDSALYVLGKLAVRNRVPVAIAGAALLAIIAAAIGLAVLSSSLDAQRRAAEAALAESNLQRARLLARTGNVLPAEQRLWQEALNSGVVANAEMGLESDPSARRAAWALLELYSAIPKAMTVPTDGTPHRIFFAADGRSLTSVHVDGGRESWSLDGDRTSHAPGFLPAGPGCRVSRDQRFEVQVDPAGGLNAYDLQARQRIAGPKPLPAAARLCSVSDDGQFTAYVDDCGTAYVLETRTLTTLRTFEGGITSADMVGPLLFLTVQLDPRPEVLVYSLQDWSRISTLRIPDVVKDFIPWARVGLSPDGSYALVSYHAGLYLFDPHIGGDPLASRYGTSSILRLEFEADGRLAAAVTLDGVVTIWTIPALETRAVLRNMSRIMACDIHGDFAATANEDASVTVWRFDQTHWPTRLPGIERTIHGLAVSPDGSTLAAGDDDGWLTLHRQGGSSEPIRAHQDTIRSIDFAPAGDRFATAGKDGAVREWSAAGQLLRDIAVELGQVWCVRYSPAGDWIASGGADGRVCLWNSRDLSTVRSLSGHRTRVPQLDFSPDGRLLVTVSQTGEAILWNTCDATALRTFGRPLNATRAIQFSPDGGTIAIGADDRTIRFWDTRSGELRATMSGMPWAPFDLRYHPSGRALFAVGSGGEIVVVDPEQCVELAMFPAHERLIMALRFSPDGRTVITAGEDHWIGLWDLDHLRRCAAGNAAFHRARSRD